jgi:hypothetical protein
MARKRYYIGGVRVPYAQFKRLTKAIVPKVFQDMYNKAIGVAPIRLIPGVERKRGLSRKAYYGSYDSRRQRR